MPGLRRLGPRHPRTPPFRQYSAWRRGRDADTSRRRRRGRGQGRSGGRSLHLRVDEAASFFSARRRRSFCRVPISMVQAALGAEVSVHTLDGVAAKVKIPEGTQSGKQFKLKNKGMPVLRSRDTGDLYIEVTVETPQSLTKRQRELLAEFEALSSQRHASGIRWLFCQDERLLREFERAVSPRAQPLARFIYLCFVTPRPLLAILRGKRPSRS